MAEGDKDTCGLLANLVQIRDAVSVPVIVKETGCGIAAEQYELLLEQGFTAFDCAGAGGTNFPAIEAKRQGVELTEEFAAWGVPTCWSLLDAQQTLPQNALLLASGGIRTAGDAARAFALGADAVGITAPLLRLVIDQGVDAAADYVEALADGLQKYMLLLGCLTPKELRDVPLIVTGETRDFVASRGYELAKLCRWRRG